MKKKSTRVFQLAAMPEPVTLFKNPKDKKWYSQMTYGKDNEIFIRGKGWKKITKTWEIDTVHLTELTAEKVKEVCDVYGFTGALAVIQGGGSQSMWHDGSYGLENAKFEVASMATIGKPYDVFTDAVQEIGDIWIKGLLSKGFSMRGKTLWYNYKDTHDCSELVGTCGVYEKIKLHPLLHVDHYLGKSFFACRVLPSFNPISFDAMLVTLMYKKHYSESGKKFKNALAKYVSVYDRIKHLAGVKAAKAIESIFKLQEGLDISKPA